MSLPQGFLYRPIRIVFGVAAALTLTVGVGTAAATPPLGEKTIPPAVETEGQAPPPPPRKAQIQYGVALTVEGVVHAGPVCADANQPCILGSGGGIDVRVGWRSSEKLYVGGAYELSKQEPSKLFRLAILQQARLESRVYFPTGLSTEPFVFFEAGLAGYGNEWGVATWGPSVTVGGGLELELSGGSLLDVSLAYRPIYLRSFEDSIPAFHEAGIAHFVTFEIALEAQDTL